MGALTVLGMAIFMVFLGLFGIHEVPEGLLSSLRFTFRC